MCIFLMFKFVFSLSQYNHMILNKGEIHVVHSVNQNYTNNTEGNLIIDNKYTMFEHQLDIGQYVDGKLIGNQLWLLSKRNGKFDLHTINLPMDIIKIQLQVSIFQNDCNQFDAFYDNQIIIFCYDQCYSIYFVYNPILRILKQYKLNKEKCNIKNQQIVVDQNYIIQYYDNVIQVISNQFIRLCQMKFKYMISSIYYKNLVYIYTDQNLYYVLEVKICHFEDISYLQIQQIINGNSRQIGLNQRGKINLNGTIYKINDENIFFNDKFLIFQQFDTFYVYDYDTYQLVSTFSEHENSKMFINIELFDIYILDQNMIKLINIQEENYYIIKPQYKLEVQFKIQNYLFIKQDNTSTIMKRAAFLGKIVITHNKTQIDLNSFDGGGIKYKFEQLDKQDEIQIEVKFVNVIPMYKYQCNYFEISNQYGTSYFICQHYNLSITMVKFIYQSDSSNIHYHLDQALTKDDHVIMQESNFNLNNYIICRVQEQEFKLFSIDNYTLNLKYHRSYDKLIAFDEYYIFYQIGEKIYRQMIISRKIEELNVQNKQLFIDKNNYFTLDIPYLNYYSNHLHSQQFYVGHNFVGIKSFDHSIIVILVGQLQMYHKLNNNKILYIGDIDLYDHIIDESCQFVADTELLYVRCLKKVLIFDPQQSLQQCLIRIFETDHSFPLLTASKLNLCFEEIQNIITCSLAYQMLEINYSFKKPIHIIKANLKIIAQNKYSEESIIQQMVFQNQFQPQENSQITYYGFKGQTRFKLDHISLQNNLFSDYYEITRSIQIHETLEITSLNFIVIIEQDKFKVFEQSIVTNQLNINAQQIQVIYNSTIYYLNNKTIQFYECNIKLQCNFTLQLELNDSYLLKLLQFGNLIVIQQYNILNMYEYKQRQINRIRSINKQFHLYHIYEDVIAYLINNILTISNQIQSQEYDLNQIFEVDDVGPITNLVVLNNQIDVIFSDNYKILIYRFKFGQQPELKAMLFKENIIGTRMQFTTIPLNNSLLIAFNQQTIISLYIYKYLDETQYLYPIKTIQFINGFYQSRGMQLFIIKDQVVLVFKYGMQIRIIHLLLDQYLLIEHGVFHNQLIPLRVKTQQQTILLKIEVINKNDYLTVFIIFLILIFVYLRYLQLKN